MVYKNININPLDDGMFMVKNLLNKKYIKLDVSELKYLLSELNIYDVNIDLNQAITLDINSQKIFKSKFIEWGFIQGEKNSNIKDKSGDISQIVVFRFNPSQFLESIPHCVISFFSKFRVWGLILLFFMKIPIILYS